MRLPRDLGGRDLAKALEKLGYALVHRVGSHMKCRTEERGGLTITIPDHSPLKTGMLARILRRVALHHGMTREELLRQLLR